MTKKAPRKLGEKNLQAPNPTNPAPQPDPQDSTPEISIQLETNRRLLQDNLSSVSGLTFYDVETPYDLQMLIVYLAGSVKKDDLNRDVINPFIVRTEIAYKEQIVDLQAIKNLLLAAPVSEAGVFNAVTTAISQGSAAIFIQGLDTAFIFNPSKPKGTETDRSGSAAKSEGTATSTSGSKTKPDQNSTQSQSSKKAVQPSADQNSHPPSLPSQLQKRKIFPTVDENLTFIKNLLGTDIGLITGNYQILGGKVKAGIAYIESISNQDLIFKQVVEPLLAVSPDQQSDQTNSDQKSNHTDIITQIQTRYISVPDAGQSDRMEQIVEGLMSGNTVLFVDQSDRALVIGSRKLASRAIEKPLNEVTVLASLEAFSEDLETNYSQIIKRVPTPDLRFESFTVGRLSHTQVKLLWIEGIADSAAVDEARCRLRRVDIDGLDGIGMLGVLIEDQPVSIFPKYKQTERPDVVSRYLYAGHFAIICGNDPYAIVAPITFWDTFKTMDDYAERFMNTTYLRIVRYLGFAISILISPLYLAFVTYNHSVVPPALALAIASGREGVPFPSVVEMLIMTMAISIIREAAIRMPGSVSFFIGTLAAVVIGQAAVTAGYLSASLIIVTAVSAIGAFAISSATLVYASRLINYSLIILAGFFGIFGVLNGLVLLFWHMISLKSFGVPFLYPVVPFEGEGWKDTLIRTQYSSLRKRLKLIAPTNRTRFGTKGLDKHCPKDGEDE